MDKLYQINSISADDFIREFCSRERERYATAIVNIFDFAKTHFATRIIIGGSFVTNKQNPEDLDCMIVFSKERYIPEYVDCAQMDSLSYDILYATEDNPNLVDTYIKMMRSDQYGNVDKDVYEVLLNDKSAPWVVRYEPSDEELTIINRVYSGRTFIERNKRRGLLVIIHGVNTRAEWLSNLIPAANHQGWIVAPFIYHNPKRLIVSPKSRKEVIEQFREWLDNLLVRYNCCDISVLGHSFGTYIITKFLDLQRGSEDYLYTFDTLFLTGGIINPAFDWKSLTVKCVSRVINVQTKNDEWVRFMPNSGFLKFGLVDKICGRCAIDGFSNTDNNVKNVSYNFFGHTNMFHNDFTSRILLPHINANNGVFQREFILKLIERKI